MWQSEASVNGLIKRSLARLPEPVRKQWTIENVGAVLPQNQVFAFPGTQGSSLGGSLVGLSMRCSWILVFSTCVIGKSIAEPRQ